MLTTQTSWMKLYYRSCQNFFGQTWDFVPTRVRGCLTVTLTQSGGKVWKGLVRPFGTKSQVWLKNSRHRTQSRNFPGRCSACSVRVLFDLGLPPTFSPFGPFVYSVFVARLLRWVRSLRFLVNYLNIIVKRHTHR